MGCGWCAAGGAVSAIAREARPRARVLNKGETMPARASRRGGGACVARGCYAAVFAAAVRGFEPQWEGMGAAGGLAAAACALLSAEMVSGVECVLDLVGFDELVAGCDLCVTGEGHADAQSAHGKVVSGVAARCRCAGVPCVAVVGGMDEDA